MKKIIILVLGMFLLFSCGENKEDIKEIEKIETKIDVKIIEEKKVEIFDKNIEKKDFDILGETDYFYTDHIKLYLVGGKILNIINTETKEKILFDKKEWLLTKNKSYSNIQMFEEYFLPKDEIYKINFKKYKQYPWLELYIKIPHSKKIVEILNYENIATNSNDETIAEVIVGILNKDKDIKREWENKIKAEHDGFYKIIND